MTFVREQSPAELRAHMNRLQKMPGWHEPLADRLYQEILDLDRQIAALKSQQEDDARDAAKWRHAVENWRILRVEVMPGVRLFHPKGIPWRDLDTQVQAAMSDSAGEGGKNG
ncbi:hypothetical protein CAL14_08270 [Bordetella genomosp. 9]|uniref:hypothetical protein n=1 Tax=Bordetella genomosp. 9 TaxID=1416803 RepID=UPI000A291D65|nr:hypothetical protein [Bordetella genomosp. 9]ARP90279.1 hypothetical protein CAL14_08270 [Bordetella genomosp. 9]